MRLIKGIEFEVERWDLLLLTVENSCTSSPLFFPRLPFLSSPAMESVTSAKELDDLLDTYSADVSSPESCSGYSHDDCNDEDSKSDVRSSTAAECCLSGNLRFSAAVPAVCHVSSPSAASDVEKEESGEVELMKERFAKLLLGQDLSGGGKGVCTALAISNAISHLSASIFGELWKLEPLPPPTKSTWWREMEWLLSVTNFIVEFSPSTQELLPRGGTFEVMVARPRGDIHTVLPELQKLDSALLSILDGFENSEFYYVDRAVVVVADYANNQVETICSSSVGREDKRWVPFPKVPENGLSKDTRKKLQHCRKYTSQILKAAVTINAALLAEMEVPSSYLESLPKCGKSYMDKQIYEYLTSDKFYAKLVLEYLELSSEHSMAEVADRIEAAATIWRHKYLRKQVSSHSSCNKPSWSVKVKGIIGNDDKNKIRAQRADTLMHTLRLRFPDLPQSALDMTKIRNNKDVGRAILESYSRVLKNLALNIVARIDDLIYIDDATKQLRAPLEAQDLFNRLSRGRCLVRGYSNVSHSSSQ